MSTLLTVSWNTVNPFSITSLLLLIWSRSLVTHFSNSRVFAWKVLGETLFVSSIFFRVSTWVLWRLSSTFSLRLINWVTFSCLSISLNFFCANSLNGSLSKRPDPGVLSLCSSSSWSSPSRLLWLLISNYDNWLQFHKKIVFTSKCWGFHEQTAQIPLPLAIASSQDSWLVSFFADLKHLSDMTAAAVHCWQYC